jgi:hypothetical protein
MRSAFGRRFSLVVDEDVTRLGAMRSAVEAHAFDTEVFLVDLPEGRLAVSFVQSVFARLHARRHTMVLVRVSPRSWTTAALLSVVRHQGGYDQVDVVMTAEGRPDMLPVLIADFPALRMVSPRSRPCAVVAGLIDARLDGARSA